MNILYWSPNCGSGIEQIGFVYLLLLKTLGHTIDYTNTQCMNTHKNMLNSLIHSSKYDYIVLNEASTKIFERTNFKEYPKDRVFNICHSSIAIPNNIIALSLNYTYHMRTAESFPITYPLSYPFLYKKLCKKSFYERKYKMAFIGRYHFTKFHKDVEAFLIENNITMDYSVVSNNYEGNIPSTIQFNNLNVDEIYDLLLDTQYLLLPSTTECLSLVVGEAQVCGCIPIVLETEMLEHDQFSLSHKCFDIASFNQAIQTIYKDKLLVDVDPSSIRHSQPWHIERVRKQLSLLFGDEHKDGIVNILDYDGLVDYINELPLKNAEIITKEALSSKKKKRFTLTLTDKCNKNCEFCYENKVRKGISLNESTLYTQIDRIMGEKVDKVIGFFGGEPFIELDLMKKAVEKLKQYKSNNLTTLSFITNGILLNSPDVMSFLQECKNDGFNPYITISYDGVQNKIANLGSNINKLVSMLGERNVRINYTLSKVNVKDIVTNYKLAESLGVKNIHYRPVHGDFVEDPTLVELYRNNMIELFNYLKTAQSMPYDIFPFIASELWDINKIEAYNYIYQQMANVGCNMDFSHLTYSMDDEVYYCHRLQFYQGFIKDVKEANQYMKDHNGTFSYAGCDTCPTLKQCGLCSVLNEVYTGDKNIPHPTLCKFQIVVHELTELFFKMFHPTFQEGYVGP